MARPPKIGISYFSLDVDIFEDEKIIPVSSEFGAKGESVIIRVLCAIYRSGYFAECSDAFKFKIAKQANLPVTLVSEVISRLIRWGFFDKSLFDSFGILTSKRIQKNWREATRKRVSKNDLIYWILDVSDKDSEFLPSETPLNQSESTQIKLNKIKVNKTITVEEKSSTGKNDFIDLLISDFQELFLKYRNRDYELTTIGKERKAIGSLLKAYKQKPENKAKTAEQTRSELKGFFERCLKISEDQNKWLHNNMTLPIINSKLNEIGNYIRASAKQSKQLDLQDFKHNMINGMEIIQAIGDQR